MATDKALALVAVSNPSPGVRVLALNRPQKRNALSQELIDTLGRELRTAQEDDDVRVVVLTGSKTLFSAGADIKEILPLTSELARKRRYLEDLCQAMHGVRKPLLAAVEGMALGGGFELALMCDLVYAASNSQFGLPEVKLGLIPGAGGTQRLTSAVGKFQAMKMIMTGMSITAAEAQAVHLVVDTFPPETVLQKAVEQASALAELSPGALAMAKAAVSRADSLGLDEEFERILYYQAMSTDDKNEGVGAFLEKRKPVW